MRVHAHTVDAIDEALRSSQGLSVEWYEALVELVLAGGSLRMGRFAEETTLSKSAATRFVDRLEQAGLVERRACSDDRRGLEVALTDAGRQAQRRAAPLVLREIQRNFGRYLDDTEVASLLGILRGVLENRASIKDS